MDRTLHHAIGKPDLLRSLIREGVPIEARDEDGCTPLFYAVIAADIACMEILLVAGADPNAVADEPAATIFAEMPLNLAHQARFLRDDERYTPVIDMLKRYRARDPH